MSVIILANGEFPKNKKIINILKTADIIICTDGAYEKALKINISPYAIVGDFDSVDLNSIKENINIVKTPDQNKSDLEKTLNYCIENKFDDVTIIGATGIKDDQTYVNLLLLDQFSESIKVQILTDYYKIFVVQGNCSFKCKKGSTVSLISFEKNNIISTKGLKYNLSNEILRSSSHGVSNEALDENIFISSSKSLHIFQEFK